MVASGAVKWFSAERGYGFIAVDGGGEDVFVHQSKIRMDGFRELQQGQRVTFETEPGRKGPQATEVYPA